MIVLIQLADVRHRHLHRRRVIAGAEDERLEPRRCLGDLAKVHEAFRAFDLDLEANLPREPFGVFDLRQQHADKPDILRQVRLRHHDDVKPVARLFNHFDEIAIRERRVEGVDAKRLQLSPEIELAKRADDVGAARRLFVDGHRILEVDAHGIRIARRRLLDHGRPRRRHIEHAALESIGRTHTRFGHLKGPRHSENMFTNVRQD